ncbi:MAG: SDR family NAD(P)-dependent oxidoreductase [Chloroflexota bacterium]|nr:SDR family NAD(P)-dependent oxidoreductase [Chloroflexota bacterium]MDE2941454.1 SDR family NAD(P)-dependent oxidoreductase [Chloroflexota bacterium]MDE3268545.1 SDR family NAD(P)-dependent oxidoreductase [Chloroflexota bacterium]
MSLQGKRTLVTGGSRGIGYEICKIFLENGADVLAVSRDRAKLDQAQRELSGLRVLQADVSTAADNDRIAEWVSGYWGALDVLVNNAGVSPKEIGGLYDLPDYEFERTIAINVTGVYLCTKRLIPLLLESDDPRVINVGSTSGVMSQDLRGVYGVSKAALHALTIASAGELAGKAAVNALSPGWVLTDMAPDAPLHPRTSAEAALWLVTQPREVTGLLFHDMAELGWSG